MRAVVQRVLRARVVVRGETVGASGPGLCVLLGVAAGDEVSDAERLIDGSRARLWIHGHTHDSFDYCLNGTRVVCNPRGYARNGVNENPLFDANFLVEID